MNWLKKLFNKKTIEVVTEPDITENEVTAIEEPERLVCTCGNERDMGNAIDENGIRYCLHCGYDR